MSFTNTVRVEGLDRLPPGRGLLVANHAFGWDVKFLMSRIRRVQGRQVWVLGEHAWWKFPFLRRLAREVGTVDGTPENLDTLLERDQLVLVLPGGLRRHSSRGSCAIACFSGANATGSCELRYATRLRSAESARSTHSSPR